MAGAIDARSRSNGSSVARIPSKANLRIEVRQVFEADDFGGELTPEVREQEKQLREQGVKK